MQNVLIRQDLEPFILRLRNRKWLRRRFKKKLNKRRIARCERRVLQAHRPRSRRRALKRLSRLKRGIADCP